MEEGKDLLRESKPKGREGGGEGDRGTVSEVTKAHGSFRKELTVKLSCVNLMNASGIGENIFVDRKTEVLKFRGQPPKCYFERTT